jgi:hypothetical protein
MKRLLFALAALAVPATARAQEVSDSPAPPPAQAPPPYVVTQPAPAPLLAPGPVYGPGPGSMSVSPGAVTVYGPAPVPAYPYGYGYGYAPPPAPVQTYAPPSRQRSRRWYFQMEGGASYQRIYSMSIYGGRFGMGADLELDHAAISLGAQLAYGALDSGLKAVQFEVGPSFAARAGIVHIGGGLGLGLMSISTVTPDPAAVAPAFDFYLLMNVDVVPLDPDNNQSALYVGLKLSGDIVTASDATPVVWGPSAIVGLRL